MKHFLAIFQSGNLTKELLVAALLTLVFIELPAQNWFQKFDQRYEDHKALEDGMADKSPKGESYNDRKLIVEMEVLARMIDLNTPESDWTKRMAERVHRISTLDETQLEKGVHLSNKWVRTVGGLANTIATRHRINMRSFLQTNHISIIREGAIAVSFLLYQKLIGTLEETDIDDAIWGIALLNVAIEYNARARQQRQPLYFPVESKAKPRGIILDSPGGRHLWRMMIFDRVHPSIRLSRRRYRRALTWFNDVGMKIND